MDARRMFRRRIPKTENGVVVEVKQQQPTDVRKVRLEVMGEKLIHVSATPEKEFSKEQSLIVIPQQNKTDFKVEEQGDEVTVKTSGIMCHCVQDNG